MLFTDQEQMGLNFIKELEQQHKKYIFVLHHQGDLISISKQKYLLDFANYEQWKQLIVSELHDYTNIALVYLPSFELTILSETSIDYYQRVIYMGFLHLLQLEQDALSHIESIWLVTKFAQQFDNNSSINCLLSPLWSMVRVARSENFPINIFSIDFDETIEKSFIYLLQELQYNYKDLEVSYRDSTRFLPYFKPSILNTKDKDKDKYQYNSKGYYIISGGLGGLGLTFAKHLVKHGAKHLILLGRSGKTPLIEDKINCLESLGAEVIIVKCDVGNKQQLFNTLNPYLKTDIIIKGVIHAAGTLEDSLIHNQSYSSLEKVMRPKIQGAWNLYNLVQDYSIDFFISFSSIASVIGSPGQLNYSAANAFLDSFSYFLSKKEISAKVINWGPWEQIGMAAKTENTKGTHNVHFQLNSITTLEGILIFDELLSDKSIQTFIFLVNKKITNQFNDLIYNKTLSQFSKEFWSLEKDNKFINEKTSFSKPRNKDQLYNIILEITTKVIGSLSVNTANVNLGFQDLGMDSMMGLQLRNLLTKYFSITLPATLIYKYPTINDLTNHIAKIIFLEENDYKNDLSNDLSITELNVDQFSEQELADLLEKELELL